MGKQKTPLTRQLADIDLRLLRIFKAVVEAGGFSAAESVLNITTSTISNYMAELERRLDMRLCTRGRAGFSVTEHGRVVYNATHELIDALEQFRDRINSAHEHLLGDLRLALCEQAIYLPNNFIANTVATFNEQAPRVRLDIGVLTAEDVAPAVSDGLYHMGIAELFHPATDLNCTPVLQERMSLYCGRGHPLFGTKDSPATLKKLHQGDFVETSRLRSGRMLDPIMEGWRKQASALQPEARIPLIVSGKFIAYLPEQTANQDQWQDDLQRLFPKRFDYYNSYQLISRHTTDKYRIVTLFRALFEEQIKLASQQQVVDRAQDDRR